MKIQIASDTHFEFYSKSQLTDQFLQRVIDVIDKQDVVLVLAGDIALKPNIDWIVTYYKQYFKDVIHVCGNHEYYCQDIDSDYKSIVIDDVEFVMATLWTNFGNNHPFDRQYAKTRINDFRIIKGFSTGECERLFEQHLAFIKHCLTNKQASEQVVVTHFGPHPLSIHFKYKGQTLNTYFVNNLDQFIVDHEPKLWIHGHCHDSFDYVVEKTRIVCNPYGYMNEMNSYNPNLLIDV